MHNFRDNDERAEDVDPASICQGDEHTLSKASMDRRYRTLVSVCLALSILPASKVKRVGWKPVVRDGGG